MPGRSAASLGLGRLDPTDWVNRPRQVMTRTARIFR
jgi:hypothetical protein